MTDPAAAEMAAMKAQAILENCAEWSVPQPEVAPLPGGRKLVWETDEGRVLELSIMDNGLLFLSDTAAWDSSPQWVPFHVTRLLSTVYAVYVGSK